MRRHYAGWKVSERLWEEASKRWEIFVRLTNGKLAGIRYYHSRRSGTDVKFMTESQIRFNDGAAYERMMGTWGRLAGANS